IEALGQGPLSAGELASRLQVTPAALTGHLRVLREAGLVTVSLDQSDTRRHVYSVEPGPFDELSEWARGASEFWSKQLDSFTKHAKRLHDAKR
ncbi:MAG: ArsR/SmtB family transcription factor, partial [bacterium]